MAMVYKHRLAQRCTFGRLPFGAVYYTGTPTAATGPLVKITRKNVLATNVFPEGGGTPGGTAGTAPNTVVLRVDKTVMHTQANMV